MLRCPSSPHLWVPSTFRCPALCQGAAVGCLEAYCHAPSHKSCYVLRNSPTSTSSDWGKIFLKLFFFVSPVLLYLDGISPWFPINTLHVTRQDRKALRQQNRNNFNGRAIFVGTQMGEKQYFLLSRNMQAATRNTKRRATETCEGTAARLATY